MRRVLSDDALRKFNANGHVRTGIRLGHDLLSRLQDHYRLAPRLANNLGYFETMALAFTYGRDWRGWPRRIARKWAPWMVHMHYRKKVYGKACYGSSDLLAPVLRECLAQGLANCFGEIGLLVGHDIYLEKTPNHSGFHYHEDGFSWEIFYQTGDDLTLFIPLCDLNKETGGRLLVEHHPKQSVLHPERNSIYTGFAEFCQPYGVTDENGLVSRDAVKASPHRAVMSAEYARIRRSRLALCAPKPPKMAPVDAKAGEVVLFCNKRFHDVEPWRLANSRSMYIVRCFPLYDVGLAPPTRFVNNAPCNRFQIDGHNGSLTSLDCQSQLPPFVPVPA